MSSYAATYDRQAFPEDWETVSYTVRVPGRTAWQTDIETLEEARDIAWEANRNSPGHRVFAEQRYIGILAKLHGTTRAVGR